MAQLEVLGVGDAFSARHFGASFLLSAGDQKLLIDGPPGLFRLLDERGIDRQELDSVLLTHIHEDHAGGIETLLIWRRFELGLKTRLFTSARVYRAMRERLFPSFEESFSPDLKEIRLRQLEDYVDFQELVEDSETCVIPRIGVEIRHNWHPTPTLGLRFRLDHSRIGISGDTCYRVPLLDELLREGRISAGRHHKLAGSWLWEADLIYHEASRRAPGHTLEDDLLRLPTEIQRKIRLIHLSDGFRPGPLPMAREGETVIVTEKGLAIRGGDP
ncbi:MAG: MBL fold metallo-hydrolase [Acidobacteriota bacterium]